MYCRKSIECMKNACKKDDILAGVFVVIMIIMEYGVQVFI
jgi:hypothetical protein